MKMRAMSLALVASATVIAGQRTSDRLAGDPFEGLVFRSIGPATMGGRVCGISRSRRARMVRSCCRASIASRLVCGRS